MIYLARHGETEWSLSGRHTSRTDLPLTEKGRQQAQDLAGLLAGRTYSLVLSSPMQRAVETCRLAGLGEAAVITDDLKEWDYGEYEGLRKVEIRQQVPGWTIFRNGAPGGETAEQVGGRADRVIERALAAGGDVVLFSHGHMLRVVAARWLELPATAGSYFALNTATLSLLGFEVEDRVIQRWNIQPTGSAQK